MMVATHLRTNRFEILTNFYEYAPYVLFLRSSFLMSLWLASLLCVSYQGGASGSRVEIGGVAA